MYIPDKVVLQLYQMIGEIPAKYGTRPMILLSEIISNNAEEKKGNKEEEKKEDGDILS